MERRDWMGVLARAPADWIAGLWDGLGPEPAHRLLRAPEIGSVMVRGRAGATGAPFNLGEITVTRCAVRLETGEVGHGYVQGRDKANALRAALADGLLQGPRAAEVRRALVDPLVARLADRRTRTAAKAAATKVDFFTLVRGED